MVKEKIRVMCPICGMMPFLENLEQTAKEKPAEVRLYLLKFGGKLAVVKATDEDYKKKGRGSAPGYMELIDITDQQPQQVLQLAKFFKDRAELFLSELKK